jgi:hypothetical protein
MDYLNGNGQVTVMALVAVTVIVAVAIWFAAVAFMKQFADNPSDDFARNFTGARHTPSLHPKTAPNEVPPVSL